MTDLVERLRSRAWEHRWHRKYREEAADEIERLRSALEAARALASDAPQQRQPDKAAQDDAYYCGRRDEEQAWASRFANLSEMLKQSDERYMALLKNVADGMALRPPAPIIMQAPQQRQPLRAEQVWSDHDLMALNAEFGFPINTIMRFVRAVEQAHGIKEQA